MFFEYNKTYFAVDMSQQEEINFQRIKEAIEYIHANVSKQPSLEDIAEHVHLSPFHFQRLFKEWAGVSPKKFLQYISVHNAKRILNSQQTSLFDTALQTGLSGSGRLHDHFVSIESITPGEYKNKGANLSIAYAYYPTPFGKVLVANTDKGICYMAFDEQHQPAIQALEAQFPNATMIQNKSDHQKNVLAVFTKDWDDLEKVKLHLKGTDFQIKVWEALLTIPLGHLETYGRIAEKIQKPSASRAVGTAIGKNPIAYLIPCHRVIQSTGIFGGYMWGPTRKTAIIGWEASQLQTES